MEERIKIPDKYLPIGTVCRLKGGKKYVMIGGFCPVSKESDTIPDYIGIVYPEGIITNEVTLYFNHDQIEEVVFLGFSNDEDKEFKLKLKDLIEKELPKLREEDSSTSNGINTDLFNTNN